MALNRQPTLTDLLNHPNFDQQYSKSLGLRTAFARLLESESALTEVLPTLRLSTVNGQLAASIAEDSRPIIREAGMTNADLLKEAIARKGENFSRVRTYSASIANSTRTGGYANKPLQQLAESYGVEIQVSSYQMNTYQGSARADLESRFGNNALVVPDSETTSVIQVTKDGKKYTDQEIKELFNIDPNSNKPWAKRLKGMINETAIQVSRDLSAGDSKISVFTVDEKEFFLQQPGARAQVTRYADEVNETRKKLGLVKISLEEVETQAAKTLADGTMLMSRTSAEKAMSEAEKDLSRLRAELRNFKYDSSKSAQEIRTFEKQVDKLEELISKNKTLIKDGKMTAITRLYNAEGTRITNGSLEIFNVEHMKGEVRIVEDSKFIEFIKNAMPASAQLDDEEILGNYDVISPQGNIKPDDLGLGKSPFGGGKRPLSVQTMEPTPVSKGYFSNTLTGSTFGSFVGTDEYLIDSLKAELQNHLQDIKKGNISPGLKRLVKDIEATPLEGLDAAEVQAINESKAFARRFNALISAGGDLRSDPILTEQLLGQVKSHFFRRQKRGKQFTLGGATTSYEARMPMNSSESSHLRSLAFEEPGNRSQIAEVFQPGQGSFTLRGLDALKYNAAFGGFDFDDSFYGRYVYDSSSKRLLYQMLRDPNSMPEYAMTDVDVSLDKNMPEHIRVLEKRKNEILKEIASSQKSPTAQKSARMVAELNNIRNQLDQHFSSGGIIGPNGEKVLIQQMNVNKVFGQNGMFEPVNTSLNLDGYMDGANIFSNQELDASDPKKAISSLRKNLRFAQGAGQNPFGLFSAVGAADSKAYSKYYSMFDFRASEVVADKSYKKLSTEAMYEALEASQANGSLLGRMVNQDTVVDSFLTTYFDFMDDFGTDNKTREALTNIVNKSGLGRIERESLIDAFVKSSDPDILNFATSLLGDVDGEISNVERLGRVMRQLQEYSDINNLGMNVGIDPKLAQERLSERDIDALKRGYGGDSVLLDFNDPRATQAKMYQDFIGMADNYDEQAEGVLESVMRNTSEFIGDDFTDAELRKASSIVQDYESGRKLLSAVDPSARNIYDALEGSTEALNGYVDRSMLQARVMKQLEGLDTSGVLAVARTLIDSGSDLSLFKQSTEISGMGDLSPNQILQSAMAERSVLEQFRNVTSVRDLKGLVEYDSTTKSYQFTGRGNSVIDIRSRNIEARNAMMRVQDDVRGRLLGINSRRKGPKNRRQQFLEMAMESSEAFIDDLDTSMDAPTTVSYSKAHSTQLGEMGNAMRTIADNAANEVSSGGNSLMKRFGRADLSGGEPVAKAMKRGLVGIAAFAGFGLTHRIITGDRSVEDLDPYPLIPQGSEYESILNAGSIQAQQGISQGGGTRYTIRASGVSDSAQLSNSIQGVLPNGNTTIYNSQARPGSNGFNSDSRSILQDRLG